jgi:NTP pyrophosphatase (non-canonical NTP hydrolase)
MTANGLAKLIEECGELLQAAGKRLAYYHTNEHPDGGDPLDVRLEHEIADVMAACRFYVQTAGLRADAIAVRSTRKLQRFREWHAMPGNNRDAIDRASAETCECCTPERKCPDHGSCLVDFNGQD